MGCLSSACCILCKTKSGIPGGIGGIPGGTVGVLGGMIWVTGGTTGIPGETVEIVVVVYESDFYFYFPILV